MIGTKKNFRCADDEVWKVGIEKTESMRRAGYDIDMSMVLNQAIRQLAAETVEQTARRLELVAADKPVPLYRRPGQWGRTGNR